MRALTPLVLASLLAACGGGDGDSPFTAGTGTLRLALTDAPACGYDSVNVTIDRVRVHTSSSAGESDAGWHDIVLSEPRRVDLLEQDFSVTVVEDDYAALTGCAAYLESVA